MHTALIVDDERLARRDLRQLLDEGHAGEVRVVGEAATLQQARALAQLLDPDVVFLDIHLGGESGFDLLSQLDHSVAVVFVTAFDRYAIRAFEVNAVDYLLKPVAPGRLAATLARLRQPAAVEPPSEATLAYDDRMFLRLDERMVFLPVRDIVAIRAAGDNTILHLTGGRLARARKALGQWVKRLPEREFVRIHRSTVVNLEYVERLEEWSHSTFRVYLRDLAEPLPMSRRSAARLRSRLG